MTTTGTSSTQTPSSSSSPAGAAVRQGEEAPAEGGAAAAGEWRDREKGRRIVVDRSTLTLLEHVNLNVPSHEPSLTFYFEVLGCGMDPRKAGNLLDPQSEKKTVWANCGASQFHLPRGAAAQVIPGMIGLRYDSLQGLKSRVSARGAGGSDGGDDDDNVVVRSAEAGTDSEGRETLRLVDKYGNVFLCRSGGNPVSDPSLEQPVIRSSEADRWGWVAEKYGARDGGEAEDSAPADCRGIDFVEFRCPRGAAEKIALFYESVLDATTSVVRRGDDDDGAVAVVAFGSVDANGRADQSLLFRETDQDIPPYDGHHVALYVGQTRADFEQAFKNCETAGVVWVNPRFDDKASNLQGAKKWKQFRFKDIVDMRTGETVFELEHEVRSIEHSAWPGPKSASSD
jgi:catechol 2,3-dioxygenase-like lactoylglutathione lyase family enzyme